MEAQAGAALPGETPLHSAPAAGGAGPLLHPSPPHPSASPPPPIPAQPSPPLPAEGSSPLCRPRSRGHSEGLNKCCTAPSKVLPFFLPPLFSMGSKRKLKFSAPKKINRPSRCESHRSGGERSPRPRPGGEPAGFGGRVQPPPPPSPPQFSPPSLAAVGGDAERLSVRPPRSDLRSVLCLSHTAAASHSPGAVQAKTLISS